MSKAQLRQSSIHHRLNTVLTCIVIFLGFYITAFPFLPQVGWWWHHRHNTYIAQSFGQPVTQTPTIPLPKENLLVIPRLEMRQDIHSGPSIAELNKGVWLIPTSSTPDKQSNSVMVGHRFTYSGPAVFYFLDKIELNDQIMLNWEQREYTYKVISIKVVPPTDLSVEAPTDKPQLTLYTCTPLWSAKNRLVITAALEGVRK